MSSGLVRETQQCELYSLGRIEGIGFWGNHLQIHENQVVKTCLPVVAKGSEHRGIPIYLFGSASILPILLQHRRRL